MCYSRRRKCFESFLFDDTGRYSGYNIILSHIYNKLSTAKNKKKYIEKGRKKTSQIINSGDLWVTGLQVAFAHVPTFL